MPPLKGPRLRQALSNVVEDQLIQDPQTYHIAVDPVTLPDGRRVVAVIDRGWFRFVREAFGAAGHRNIKAVPAMRCLPVPAAILPGAADNAGAEERPEENEDAAEAPPTPFIAGLLGHVISTAPALIGELLPSVQMVPTLMEVAIARGARAALGEGLALPEESVASTLHALAGDHPVVLYSLVDLPGDEPRLSSVRGANQAAQHMAGAQPLAFEALARHALASRFDLCQFEFAAQPWRLDRSTMRRLRVPIALVAASVIVSIIGVNVQWLQLSRQRDAISAQMTELLLNAFPKTTIVLDAPDQMTRNLDRLRTTSGELSPSDFLSLTDGLARTRAGAGKRHRRAGLSGPASRSNVQAGNQSGP